MTTTTTTSTPAFVDALTNDATMLFDVLRVDEYMKDWLFVRSLVSLHASMLDFSTSSLPISLPTREHTRRQWQAVNRESFERVARGQVELLAAYSRLTRRSDAEMGAMHPIVHMAVLDDTLRYMTAWARHYEREAAGYRSTNDFNAIEVALNDLLVTLHVAYGDGRTRSCSTAVHSRGLNEVVFFAQQVPRRVVSAAFSLQVFRVSLWMLVKLFTAALFIVIVPEMYVQDLTRADAYAMSVSMTMGRTLESYDDIRALEPSVIERIVTGYPFIDSRWGLPTIAFQRGAYFDFYLKLRTGVIGAALLNAKTLWRRLIALDVEFDVMNYQSLAAVVATLTVFTTMLTYANAEGQRLLAERAQEKQSLEAQKMIQQFGTLVTDVSDLKQLIEEGSAARSPPN